MTEVQDHPLKNLPLHEEHVKLGARIGAFGEWQVPLYYTSILNEHEAVRTAAGVFDISHMGEFFFEGKDVIAFLDYLLPRPITNLTDGKAIYMPLLNEAGGIIDDIILYRISETSFIMIVNAGNVAIDCEWVQSQLDSFLKEGAPEVTFKDRTEDFGLLAVQGPKSREVVEAVLDTSLEDLKYYRCLQVDDVFVARTGYTGENGYELMVEVNQLPKVWQALMTKGEAVGLKPIGFGARDTLRLEAGMLLHGHDMNDSINPLQAGIGWAIDLSKQTGIGLEAVRQSKEQGIGKTLIGFELIGKGIPREGCGIRKEGADIGEVTSGTMAPWLKKSIGLGYSSDLALKSGDEVAIVIRDREIPAKVVELPFYKKPKQ